jgi:hypothetical protein
MRNPALALADILVLWALILGNVLLFSRVSPTSSYLLLPYLGWVSLATLLNAAYPQAELIRGQKRKTGSISPGFSGEGRESSRTALSAGSRGWPSQGHAGTPLTCSGCSIQD